MIIDKSKVVIYWWLFLSIISIINISFITNYLVTNKLNSYQKNITILALIYTFICGLRSFYPKNDLMQNCLFNSFLSTPIFGRTIATIAEMTLIYFFVLIFRQILNDFNFEKLVFFNNNLNYLIFIIAIAQIFCWIGCITKNSLYNSIEESLWLVTFCILLFCAICIKNDLPNNGKGEMTKRMLSILIPSFIIYILFLFFIDIPMYYKNWKVSKDKISSDNFYNNMINFSKCNTINWSYDLWKEEIPWQTGYFTLAVWSTIYLTIWFNKYLEI